MHAGLVPRLFDRIGTLDFSPLRPSISVSQNEHTNIKIEPINDQHRKLHQTCQTTKANKQINSMQNHTMIPPQSNILLFGGSGFIGKVLLERLLAQSKTSTIFLVLRPKRGATPEERLEKLHTLPCFQNVQDAFDAGRVIPIAGDITLPDLGISDSDRKLLAEKVTSILSVAACIDFDLPIATAAMSNTMAALNILGLAKKCQNLESFVHCSPAYVMSPRASSGPIPEEYVSSFANGRATQVYDRIMQGMTEEEEKLALQESGFPNTYTYTKALTETLLIERHGSIPLAIVRPSIVTACLQYPIPGWIDSKAACNAILAMYGSGFLHTMPAKADVKSDIVPCDYVANRMIYAAFGEMDRSEVRIIHATAGLDQSLEIGEIMKILESYYEPKHHHTKQRPFLRIVAPCSDPRIAKSFAKDKRRAKFLQWMARLLGQKKAAFSLGRVVQGLGTVEVVFNFFNHNYFDFQSKETISDVMPFFDTHEFWQIVNKGVHCYLLGGKERPEGNLAPGDVMAIVIPQDASAKPRQKAEEVSTDSSMEDSDSFSAQSHT
jgi:alcohol-forming fatty acyl-CoA reductase